MEFTKLVEPEGGNFVPRMIIGITFTMLVIAEWVWSRQKQMHIHDGKETAANFVVLLGNQISKALFLSWQLWILTSVADYKILSWEPGILSFIGTFFLVDFFYYWQHRIMHETKLFWAFHLVHHSGQKMNLTTSFRLNWLSPLVGSLFYIPVALLGAPSTFILMAQSLNLFFQFFLHTESIGKLGFMEGFINTPSAHRVHHGSNPEYIDKNYGGVLMIWDRLFGSYTPETSPVQYGITTGHVGYNPFTLVFHGFYDLFRGKLNSKG
jgi:sterol desaturase/sphingolipid hydroxylase (fatty acid hydroxylase superfamily)